MHSIDDVHRDCNTGVNEGCDHDDPRCPHVYASSDDYWARTEHQR